MIIKVENDQVIAIANDEEVVLLPIAKEITSVQLEKTIEKLTSLQKFQIIVESAKSELKKSVTPAPKKRAPRKKARVETVLEEIEAEENATIPYGSVYSTQSNG